MRENSKFIAIEGIDGTGKSTLCRRLATRIELETNRCPRLVHEPGSTALEPVIREIFKSEAGPLDANEMAILFTADRVLHMREHVIPLLEAGEIVITDRHHWSTMAYQRVRGAETFLLNGLHFAAECLVDDVILLTVDPEVAVKRLAQRSKLDHYERDVQLLRDTQNEYLRMFEPECIIDTTNLTMDEVTDRAMEMLGDTLS